MPESHDLVAHARDVRVVVIGGGLAGSVAALACAKVGMTVTLVEAADRLGGALAPADLAGVAVDTTGADFSADDAEVAALLDELELSHLVRAAPPVQGWIGGLGGSGEGAPGSDAAPIVGGSLFGIPANPWDAAVRRVIGWGGVWRAYVDRLRPPLTIGHQRNLGALVRTRMGDAVCDRLVAPVTRGLLGLEPHEVDADAAVPGISTALTRTGSLAGAVASLSEGRATRSTLAGGLHVLPQALAARLDTLAVDVRTETRATHVTQEGGSWAVAVTATADAAESGDAARPAGLLEADAVVVAVPEAEARALLAGVAAMPAAPVRPETAITMLRLRMRAPERADVFPWQGDVWRVTDVTGPAADTAAPTHAAAADERIVRVTGPAEGGSDAALVARALAAASSAFATELSDRELVASAVVRLPWSPVVRLDRVAEADAVRRALGEVAGLAVTGAWLSGDGIEHVVADAVAEATRLRRRALWGGSTDPLGS